MRQIMHTTFLVITFLVIGIGSAYAENFQAEVKGIESQSGVLTVVARDSGSGGPEKKERKIQVLAGTRLENFASLEELRIGDELTAEASEGDGVWQAQKLSVSKVKIR